MFLCNGWSVSPKIDVRYWPTPACHAVEFRILWITASWAEPVLHSKQLGIAGVDSGREAELEAQQLIKDDTVAA